MIEPIMYPRPKPDGGILINQESCKTKTKTVGTIIKSLDKDRFEKQK